MAGRSLQRRTEMSEECLLSIIDAADPDDEDDLMSRSLLVLMLRESGLGPADLIGHEEQATSPSCPFDTDRMDRLAKRSEGFSVSQLHS